MKGFRKRTLALVVASVITVVGSFASENYKNSLREIKFEPSGDNSVSMILGTRSRYDGNITPVKKDSTTFVLMLPEINSLASTPDLTNAGGNIASVNIRTMPYSSNAKGYTRITIKTLSPTVSLQARNEVYIETNKKNLAMLGDNASSEIARKNALYEERRLREVQKAEALRKMRKEALSKPPVRETKKEVVPPSNTQNNIKTNEKTFEPVRNPEDNKITTAKNAATTQTLLWALLIVFISAFYFMKANKKMQEIAGERLNLDTSSESDLKETHKKINKIKNAVNTIDSAYSRSATMVNRNEYTVSNIETIKSQPKEDFEVIDLDALFKEKVSKNEEKTKDEEENEALEDFLSGFSFQDEQEEIIEDEELNFDEDAYAKIINNKAITFNKNDLECINQLLNLEINNETMRNIDKYLVSNPIDKKSSKNKVLEDLVTSYAISQNVIFSSEDILALNKLMSVELDSDFITNLRTNPQRTKEMQDAILEYGDKPKKPSEIVMLGVKDLLPDLSEALRQQGDKAVESNHRPEIVYFNEGYDVKTLSLNVNLPDLSKEVNNKEAYVSKPSAGYEIVDNNYIVGDYEIKVSEALPDLQDALINPEKYQKQEDESPEVDEETLLNQITNVKFKPFYDGSEEFEVLNKFEQDDLAFDTELELNQLVKDEITNEVVQDEEKNLVSDGTNIAQKNDSLEIDKEIKPQKTERKKLVDESSTALAKENSKAQLLINKLEQVKLEREARRRAFANKQVAVTPSKKKEVVNELKNFVLEGEAYVVASSATIDENKSCYLLKNEDNYVVIANIANNYVTLKKYEQLKSEKIQVRISEKISENNSRYIVRIGINKFIINVGVDTVEYVMDLC